MAEPRDLAQQLESNATLPSGDGERFSGYGVMSCPFASGDVLCHRRFPASSIGPAYASIWHRGGEGAWTFYQDVPPRQACPRFFGAALSAAIETPVTIEWPGPRSLRIAVPDALDWTLELQPTFVTRTLNAIGGAMPSALWRNAAVLRAMSAVAGLALGAGKLALSGRAPNGQQFIANPLLIWRITQSHAVLGGRDLGPLSTMREQVCLGDFWIPRTGLLAIGRAFFEPFDEERHQSLTHAA